MDAPGGAPQHAQQPPPQQHEQLHPPAQPDSQRHLTLPAAALNPKGSLVEVRLRVPYFTAWGQSVVACGECGALGWSLGDGDGDGGARGARCGARMACHFEGEALVWEARVLVPADRGDVRYRYAVVDEAGDEVDREAPRPAPRALRAAALAAARAAGEGAYVAVGDEWNHRSAPEAALGTAAFQDVLLARRAEDRGHGDAADDGETAAAATKSEARSQQGLPVGVSAGLSGAPSKQLQPGLAAPPAAVRVRFDVRCDHLRPGELVVVVGSASALGGGNARRAARMREGERSVWTLECELPREELSRPITYRFAVLEDAPARSGGGGGGGADAASSEEGVTGAADARVRFEDGEARVLWIGASDDDAEGDDDGDDGGAGADGGRRAQPLEIPSAIACDGGHVRRALPWRGAGVASPVFALRSASSLGCGEFADLRLLVDVAAAAGLRMIQLLPVNDTCVHGTWWDSYPYSSLSVFALHPMYLRVEELVGPGRGRDAGTGAGAGQGGAVQAGSADESAERRASTDAPASSPPALPLPADVAAMAAEARTRLNGLPQVDYQATLSAKLRIAREVFRRAGDDALLCAAFLEWESAQEEWLLPYSVFCALRDTFGHAEHWRWGDLAAPTMDRLRAMAALHPRAGGAGGEGAPLEPSPVAREASFWRWLQWQLHLQLGAAARYATSRRVVLKGDLPIGVDKGSVDTWVHPELFRMDKRTGAPPDAFDPNGQNWGFPTYNWEAMSRDGYAWWRRRLAGLSQYFSAYRIDHILGFFRIWEMPEGTTTGLLGRFRPSVPLWRDELEAQGVWDFDRLCEPFITEELVEEVFGEELAPLVMGVTEDVGHGRLRLVSGLHTEELICEVLGAGCEEGALRAERKGGCGYSASAAAGGLGGGRSTAAGSATPKEARPAAQGAEADAGGGVAAEAALWAFRAAVPALGGATRAALRRGLLQLVQNVCLLRDPDEERRFYPRILVERTQSFGALDERTQQALSNLYRSYFFERQDDLWAANARRTIPALMGATRMLVCGEDLGMLPTCCPPTLRSLGLLGLRIQRMPVGEGEFGEPADYPYLSVCSPSCHDTTPTRAWWEEDHARAGRLWRDCLGREGEPPRRATPEVVRAVVEQHMRSPSMWAVFPLQDLYALSARHAGGVPASAETINDPTNPKHYWRLRFHVALEELLADEGWLAELRGLVRDGGRQHGERA